MIRLLLATALVASACAGETTVSPTTERTSADLTTTTEGSSADLTTTTEAVAGLCESSFQQAAGVGDMEDRNEDMFAAAANCTLADAEAMSVRYEGALDGVDPETYFINLCSSYGNDSIQGATFTALVASASGTVGETPLCTALKPIGSVPADTTNRSRDEAAFIAVARDVGFVDHVAQVLKDDLVRYQLSAESQVLGYGLQIAVDRDILDMSIAEAVEDVEWAFGVEGLSKGYAAALVEAAWPTLYLED